MNPILGVAIGVFMPMLFGFTLGVLYGKQAKAKEIFEEMIRPTKRPPDVATADFSASVEVKIVDGVVVSARVLPPRR